MRKLSKKQALVMIAMMILAVAVYATVNGLRSRTESRETASWAAPFGPHLEEYLQASATVDEQPPTPVPEEGSIRGKLVVVNRLKDELDEVNSSDGLAEIRAESPEEVGTVVWTDYWSTWDHTVHGGAINKSYYNYNIGVTVVDFAQKRVVCKRTFSGTAEETYGGQFTAPWLPDEVVAYLQSLPRR